MSVLTLCTVVGEAGAQDLPAITHERLPCLVAEARPLLEAQLRVEGTPRVYYREVGAETWCYVNGDRYEDQGIVVLPAFPAGIDVEYFFITYTEERITGRSRLVYRSRVTSDCSSVAVARHTSVIVPECEGNGAIGFSFGPIGYQSQTVEISPSTPER